MIPFIFVIFAFLMGTEILASAAASSSSSSSTGQESDWFDLQPLSSISSYKIFDVPEPKDAQFHVFKGTVYTQNPVPGVDFAKVMEGISEMVAGEKHLRTTHLDLAEKENFAQCRILALYEGGASESFSIPLLPTIKNARVFYANGTLGSVYPGFSQNIKGYPWIFQSKIDPSIMLIQRPSSTPQATERTVRLLQTLTNSDKCPKTVSSNTLRRLYVGFEAFRKLCTSIEPVLQQHLTDNFKSLSADDLAFLKTCISQMRFDLEGRYFETEKKAQEERFKQEETKLNEAKYPGLSQQLETLRAEHRAIEAEIASLEKRLQAIKQELKNPNGNGESSSAAAAASAASDKQSKTKKLSEEQSSLEGQQALLERQNSLTGEEIRKILVGFSNDSDVKILREKKSVFGRVFSSLQKTYQSIIKAQNFETLCNPKDFNFGCSEQLLIDHLFSAALDKTVGNVATVIGKKPLRTLVLVIHSTMTPCKTCTLDVALEAFHGDGRIFKFFNQLQEDLEAKSFRKIVLVSFSKSYCPTESDKHYGFAFNPKPPVSEAQAFYWLLDFSSK